MGKISDIDAVERCVEGRFITFEGGEGVGKSLLIRHLRDLLETQGFKVQVTREPGGTPHADRIRTLFGFEEPDDPWLPISEAFLVSAARAQHVHHSILPSKRKGTWVLCDRFADSTRVYQSAVEPPVLEHLISLATQGLEPDLTFLLDCPAEIALDRLRQRNHSSPKNLDSTDGISRFDTQAFEIQHQRRMKFLQLAGVFGTRMVVLDARQSPEDVTRQAVTALKARGFLPSTEHHGTEG